MRGGGGECPGAGGPSSCGVESEFRLVLHGSVRLAFAVPQVGFPEAEASESARVPTSR